MNALFHLVISTIALMLFNTNVLESQTTDEKISVNSIIEKTSDLNSDRHNEPANSDLAVSEDKLQNFLDDLGKPLLNSNDRKPQDSAEGDSFQEYSFAGAAAVDYYGFSVASAGDVNADGFDDIIVGAPFNDAGGTDAGRAYIYFGSYVIDYTADVILTGNIAGGRLGYSVSSAGDVNNDGYADVIAGATGLSANTGCAYIYYGGSNMNNVADVTLSGQSAGEQFGYSVSNAGDVNGDGLFRYNYWRIRLRGIYGKSLRILRLSNHG
ncbi:MAG: FG-GAP repeat protein [Ignavibacteria bacterium]|nr:FG-GAP repeat protein [Ignavibacteria bacterium]